MSHSSRAYYHRIWSHTVTNSHNNNSNALFDDVVTVDSVGIDVGDSYTQLLDLDGGRLSSTVQ